MPRPYLVPALCSALTFCLLSAIGFAASLPAGALISAPAEPDPTGGTVSTSLNSHFGVTNAIDGTLVSQVISGDPGTPVGGATFTYTFTDLGLSDFLVDRIEIAGFGSLLVDASYFTPPQNPDGLVPPTSVGRTANGDSVIWNFIDPPDGLGAIYPLFPPHISALLVVQTPYASYTQSVATVHAATPPGASVQYNLDFTVPVLAHFAPASTPLPPALWSGLTVLSGLALRRRYRSQRNQSPPAT